MVKQLQNNITGVFGLGQSGLAVARYLQRTGQAFYVADTREKPPGEAQIAELDYCQAAYLGEIPQAVLNQSKRIVLSPGVSPQTSAICQAKEAGAEVIGDVEIFARECKKPIVAITGSNGKSTVTDVTHRLLMAAGIDARIGGNFGVPVLDYLPQDDGQIYVLELSSFQLDTTDSLHAEVAVLLNISEDHLDRYLDFDHYCQSKRKIYLGAKACLANADDNKTAYASALRFSLADKQADFYLQPCGDDYEFMVAGQSVMKASQLKITGNHNWGNLLAAFGILTLLNVKISEAVVEAAKAYTGLPHRFQLVKTDQSVDWVNDSKATNVGATQAALEAVDNRYYSKVVLIAGGDAKGADVTPLSPLLRRKVSALVLIGKDANLLAQLVDADKVSFAKDMQSAVILASKLVNQKQQEKKALVLLSPACASLDMYPNFEVRGNDFAAAVEACA